MMKTAKIVFLFFSGLFVRGLIAFILLVIGSIAWLWIRDTIFWESIYNASQANPVGRSVMTAFSLISMVVAVAAMAILFFWATQPFWEKLGKFSNKTP